MKQNTIVIVVVAVVVILGLAGFMVGGRKSSVKNTAAPNAQSDTVPTVDASVKVDLKRTRDKSSVIISVNDMPTGTSSLDYTLSYDTKAQGSQGIIGEGIKVESNKRSFEVTRFLGTQSSGHSVYHEVVGKIKLEVKFTGSYGEKIFEREYDI